MITRSIKVKSKLTFKVDGILRTAELRVGRGMVKHVVLGFHGSGARGINFIDNWGAADEETAVIAADALDADDGNSWVIPGLPPGDSFYPTQAPSDEHDLNVLDHLIAYTRRRWPGCKVWFVGNSKGASLGWAAYAFNKQYIEAYFLAIFGAPMRSFYSSWGFSQRVNAGLVVPKPVALWHGGVAQDVRSQTYGGADSWTNSALILGIAAKGSSFTSPTQIGTADGHPLLQRDILGGVVPFREYAVTAGDHTWSAEEAGYARDFLQDQGFMS